MQSLYLLVGIRRQTHHQAVAKERELVERSGLYVSFMHQIRIMHPGMGLRKMYNQFNPEGIGRDAFIALGLQQGLRLRVISNPTRTTIRSKSWTYPNLLHELKLTDVNQVWVSDIFYYSIQGKHHYVVLIMDVYSRRIIGYNVEDHMQASSCIAALRMAIHLRGIENYHDQLIHHTDRGSQYISDEYTGLLNDCGIRVSMCTDVLENSHMERVNGTIKNDYLTRWDPQSTKQLKKELKRAVSNYNVRLHDTLNATPLQFETLLTDIPIKERKQMSIFTIKKTHVNPDQMNLFDSQQ